MCEKGVFVFKIYLLFSDIVLDRDHVLIVDLIAGSSLNPNGLVATNACRVCMSLWPPDVFL